MTATYKNPSASCSRRGLHPLIRRNWFPRGLAPYLTGRLPGVIGPVPHPLLIRAAIQLGAMIARAPECVKRTSGSEPTVERERGIEPPPPAWKAGALPLSYSRWLVGGRGRIRTSEGVRQLIYSQPPLATWVPALPGTIIGGALTQRQSSRLCYNSNRIEPP